jgi:phospholipid-binding lipoprotein MlaA
VTLSGVASRFAAAALAALLGAALARAADEPPAPAAPPTDVPAAADPAADSAPAPAPTPADPNADAALLDELDAAETTSYWDPLEPGNRVVFGMNEYADRWVIGPIADGYAFIMPDPAERAVRRMFRNLKEPISFVNHLLQFKPDPAGQTLVRFCLNSTVGVAGIFDVATPLGLPVHPTDFGGTLYRYGTPAGPYLVLPLFGPTTARDTFGDFVDGSVMPQRYLLSTTVQILLTTGNGITARAEATDGLQALRDGSIDFYAALRSAYYFNRESELRGGTPGESDTLRSNADNNASKPSRSSTEVYSALRSASSETVPDK